MSSRTDRSVGVLRWGNFVAITNHARSYLSNLTWKANAKLAGALGRMHGYATAESDSFRRKPISLGRLSGRSLATLQSLILNAQVADFDVADHAPGYVFSPDDQTADRIFKGGYRFRRLDAPQLRAIADALRELAPDITRRLGSGWRVINLKSWSTRADTIQAGPNAWHVDGFPAGTYKLMIYLTPIGPAVGTTEVRYDDGSSQILEGEAGTYLLFDPSVLWHRGIAPAEPGIERTHIEITLMHAPSIDLRLADGGLNSAHPRLPWTRRRLRTA